MISEPGKFFSNGNLQLNELLAALHNQDLISATQFSELLRYRLIIEAQQNHVLTWLAVKELQSPTQQVLSLDFLMQWLADTANLPYWDRRIDVSHLHKASIKLVGNFMNKHNIVLINETSKSLIMATAEPFNTTWVKELEEVSGKKVRRIVVQPKLITHTQQRLFQRLRTNHKAGRNNGIRSTPRVNASASFQ